MGSYGGIPEERNQEATIFVGELATEVTEALLWELMIQVGPVVSVHIPRDKVSSAHSGFGFVEFATERDAEYAIRVMNSVKLFGRSLKINKSNTNRRALDVGANLFVGNLDASVDEKLLIDTFGCFGPLLATPKIMRDESGSSKGFGFVQFGSFASADAAIEGMNGQFLANRPITVTYAYKKDSKGERHGTEAERLLEEKQRAQRLAAPAPPTIIPVAPGQATVFPAMMPMMGGMPMVMPMTITPPQ